MLIALDRVKGSAAFTPGFLTSSSSSTETLKLRNSETPKLRTAGLPQSYENRLMERS